jgi:hypothetical protein
MSRVSFAVLIVLSLTLTSYLGLTGWRAVETRQRLRAFGSTAVRSIAVGKLELARSIREAWPELVGQGCSIVVTDEQGVDVCIIPLELPA